MQATKANKFQQKTNNKKKSQNKSEDQPNSARCSLPLASAKSQLLVCIVQRRKESLQLMDLKIL